MSNASMADNAVENRNADVIAGLREVADWLEAHPELPSFGAYVSYFGYRSDEREALTAVAEALGDRAAEHLERERVYIKAEFGKVTLAADAKISALGGFVPPTPHYDPIIKESR